MKRLFFILLLLLLSSNALFAQNREIRVTSIEVDSKPISTCYKVFFSSGKKELIKAKRTKDGFIVPDEIDLTKNQTVIFAFEKYWLFFSELDSSYFDAKWKIGVDLKPFDPERLEGENPQNIEFIYYAVISFADARGASIVVRIDRQPK